MKKAYVTGGTGCVGRNIINELVRDQWTVIAIHRKSSDLSRLAGLNIELREVDIHDFNSVKSSIPEGTDAVFHAAANVSHWPLQEKEQWKDNVLGTRNLVRAAIEKKVGRFIFTSTAATAEYEGCAQSEAARIPSQYVRTKWLAELEVEDGVAQGLHAVTLWPAIIVGAFDYNNYSQIFTSMDSGMTLPVLPGSIEFCHARDVARAHISAFEKGRNGEYYCLGGPTASWLEVYEKIARLLNVPPRKRQTPLWVLYAYSYPVLWMSYLTRKPPAITPQLVRLLEPGGTTPVEEVRKSKVDLGYQSSSLDEMLKDCYEWLVKEGLLPVHARNQGRRGE
jgi:dihydroflavonol-4-reductase